MNKFRVEVAMADETIPVHECFGPTIQGEGFWTGAVVSFVRLSGCPVGCPWCDTGYADGGGSLPREKRSIHSLVANTQKRVVISGGEPFIHANISTLVEHLIGAGKNVHIETSGSFYKRINDLAWITLSPKTHVNRHYPVRPELWTRANEVKLVIADGTEVDFYAQWLNQFPGHVFLQPEHSQGGSSLEKTLNLLYANPRFRLSLQTHKMIGVL